MLSSIDMYYSELVKLYGKIAEEKYQGAKNHDIYEERLLIPEWKRFKYQPHSMFFCYVRINRDGRLVIDHYFYPNIDENGNWMPIPHDKEELCKLVKKLAINARPIRRHKPYRVRNPKQIGKGNFKKTPWDRISYVAIFFDEGHWRLRKRPKDGTKSAITFVVDGDGKSGRPNHSFFDAIDLDVEMPVGTSGDKDTRSAIVFINHMKRNEKGDQIGGEKPRRPNEPKKETQNFTFEIIVNVEAEMKDDPPTVFIIDPGGDNEGPPLPPPP
jgi:hypothetical protein